jgi:hypothetical protein
MQKDKIITDAGKKLILRNMLSSYNCGLPGRQPERTAHSIHTRWGNAGKLWAESTAMPKGITQGGMALGNLIHGSVFNWGDYF